MKFHQSFARISISGLMLTISWLLAGAWTLYAQPPPPPPPGGGLEITPITKNECYTITNESNSLGNYHTDFYDEFDNLVYSFDDQIPPLQTKFYRLADMPIPDGLYRVVIQADVPSSASKVSCSGGSDSADLVVSKSVDDPTPSEGGTIIYTITVTNNGPDQATGVQLIDSLPPGINYISDNSGGAYNSSTGVWTVGSLANGSSATLLITASVGFGTAGVTITNTANVSAADQSDPTPGNNAGSADITVQATPPTSVSISGPTTGETGTAYTFTANVSPSTATLPITYLWQATDQSPVTHTGGGLSDNVTFTWNSPGTKVVNITASNAAGNVTDNHTIIISMNDTTPPSIDNIQKSSGYVNKQGCASPNTITFRADVTDASGLAWVRLYYQPPGEVWTYTTMSLEGGNTYKATIGPFNQIGTMPYFVKARDSLDNPKEADVEYLSIACVTISHVEVIQVTQNISNTVPLIAGKPTLVRVYVDCGEGCAPLPGVTGGLEVSGPGGEISLFPSPQFITAEHPQDGWSSQRGELSKTLNFLLPTNLITGSVNFTAQVNDTNYTQTFPFNPAKQLDIIYIPVQYNNKAPTDAIKSAFGWAQKIYPTAQINYIPLPEQNWSPDPLLFFGCKLLNSGNEPNCRKELFKGWLTSIYYTAVLNGQVPLGDYIFGWLADDFQNFTQFDDSSGSADSKWNGGAGIAAFGFDGNEHSAADPGPFTFAHEVGHLLDRHHTNTLANLQDENCKKNPNGTNDLERAIVDEKSDWYKEGFPDSKIQDYGLDISGDTYKLKDPETTYDYMSYCGSLTLETVWTSPWTYRHIYSDTLTLQTTTSSAIQTLSIQPYFMISGLVFSDDTAIFEPIWVITTSTTVENPPLGTGYCLELQDIGGTPLTSRCFDLTFINYETGENTGVDSFNLILPHSNDVAQIVLKKGNQELITKLVSANAPVVTVLSPNGGETWSANGIHTISWTASDADSDPLTYNVLYSPDGSNWVPVGMAITETQLAVNTSELAGGSNAKVRVLASDGVNNSSDESDASFTVERKGPQAYILLPEGNVTIPSGTPTLLQGYAYDLEDYTLNNTALQWISSQDGNLGTGSQVVVTLSQGQHVVTLAATDNDNNTATATINVSVGFNEVYLPLILK